MPLIQLHGLVPGTTRKVSHGPIHHLLDCGDIGALTSPVADDMDFEDPTALANWASTHNRILLAYCATHPVLPMSIGAVFSNQRALRTKIEDNIDEYRAALDVLRDVQEFTIQLQVTDRIPTTPTISATGRDFLLARRTQRDRRTDLKADQVKMARDIVAQLQQYSLQITSNTPPKADRLLACSALIQRTAQPKLRQLAQRLHQPALDLGLDLVVTGPWPPYSFDVSNISALEGCDGC